MTDRKTYRAKWLLPDPWTPLENGYVLVSGSTIEDVGTGSPPKDAQVIDLGPGVMMPPLVNAHTHLELSALKGALPVDKGFRFWIAELIQKRAAFTEADLLEGVRGGIEQLLNSGCGAVGDISTLGITYELLRDSPLKGISFHEYLGNNRPHTAPAKKSNGLSLSLAAHGPHTTAPVLFGDIKRATSSEDLPMSVHLAESEEEYLFIQSARGDWADFLTSRGIDFSDWPIPSKSPVQYLHTLGVLDEKTLVVHLLHCSGEDLALLLKGNVKVCVCPRSNYLLHGKLPDLPSFLALNFKPCLGTDSLASCPSLSILDEMAFVFDQYDSVLPSDIIAMGTVYGAAALGLENSHGRLAPGFKGPPLYIDIETDSLRNVPRALVSSGNAGGIQYQGKIDRK